MMEKKMPDSNDGKNCLMAMMAMMEGAKLGLAMIEGSRGWRFREFGTALRLCK